MTTAIGLRGAGARAVLSHRLTRARAAADMTAQDACLALGWSRRDLADAEQNAADLPHARLEALLQVYGVDQDTRAELLILAESADDPGWSQAHPLPACHHALFDIEAVATRLTSLAHHLIPAAVQTTEYAHATLEGFSDLDNTARRQMIRALGDRNRRRSERRGVTERIVIAERALHPHLVRAPVLAAQARHLLTLAETGRTEIRVLPQADAAERRSRTRLSLDEAVREDFVLLDLPESVLGPDLPHAALDEAGGHVLHLGAAAAPHRDRAAIAWGDALPSAVSLTLLAAITG